MKGILVIDKKQNYTSHDCVQIVRRAAGEKKVGHTGTLDPMATGVLPVCIGKATRVIQYLESDVKSYRCEMTLGLVSDTMDIWGEAVERKDTGGVTPEEVGKTMKGFLGEISQVPPKYSAIKVKGKKLYEYAREGKEIEIKPRKVTIYDLDIIDCSNEKVTFDVTCSKGTYIRSICHDAGMLLGCGAVMSGLVRTSAGIFNLKDAVSIEDVKSLSKGELEALLLPMDTGIAFNKVNLNLKEAIDFVDGKKIKMKSDINDITKNDINKSDEDKGDLKRSIYCNDIFIGIGKYKNGIIVPEKVMADKDSLK